jgi:hypothetical protein
LDRVLFANLTKKNVDRGKWRYLNEKEVRLLKFLNKSFRAFTKSGSQLVQRDRQSYNYHRESALGIASRARALHTRVGATAEMGQKGERLREKIGIAFEVR